MPNYKTHSIHGELLYPNMDKKIEIDSEELKTFCVGPDTMIATDYKLFNYQHENKVKQYFETMIKYIKKNKLQDNSKVIGFLYGQLDHYILDITMHPLIYYMTEGLQKTSAIGPHGIIEMWIDDYTTKKFNKDEVKYYKNLNLYNKVLKKLINDLYSKVYNDKFTYLKYKYGIKLINLFDLKVRHNTMKIAPFLTRVLNIGDILYHKNSNNIEPYLNLNKDIWYNPETGEKYNESFDELWEKSMEVSLETINDVNKYLYLDKPLNNSYISNNISYSTGCPCEDGQSCQYIKKY